MAPLSARIDATGLSCSPAYRSKKRPGDDRTGPCHVKRDIDFQPRQSDAGARHPAAAFAPISAAMASGYS
jgi:hypothetical protein